jgi:hypothetical protein
MIFLCDLDRRDDVLRFGDLRMKDVTPLTDDGDHRKNADDYDDDRELDQSEAA